jgi:hypothetical protein
MTNKKTIERFMYKLKFSFNLNLEKIVLSFWFINGIMQHTDKWLGFVGNGYKYAHVYLSHIALLNCC